MSDVSSPLHILFLCTGNSARSILAEAIGNRFGGSRFIAHSAGSFPNGQVHPQALALLARRGYAIDGFRSKGWEEFAAAGAPELAIVITVCDAAAGEVCPIWPGGPVSSHWGLPDPAAVEGPADKVAAAFAKTYDALEARVRALASLRFDTLDRTTLKTELDKLASLPTTSERA